MRAQMNQKISLCWSQQSYSKSLRLTKRDHWWVDKMKVKSFITKSTVSVKWWNNLLIISSRTWCSTFPQKAMEQKTKLSSRLSFLSSYGKTKNELCFSSLTSPKQFSTTWKRDTMRFLQWLMHVSHMRCAIHWTPL